MDGQNVHLCGKAAGGRFAQAGGNRDREFLPSILCARCREFAVCADDDSSTLQVLWHCLSLSAESEIPLGERTISAGNTTAL